MVYCALMNILNMCNNIVLMPPFSHWKILQLKLSLRIAVLGQNLMLLQRYWHFYLVFLCILMHLLCAINIPSSRLFSLMDATIVFSC